MRKIEILAICCLSVLMLQSCGGCSCSRKSDSSSKSSSLSESEDLNYQKACSDLDFEKAHQILNKLRGVFVDEGLPTIHIQKYSRRPKSVSDIKGYNQYVDADIYIFREEVAYLMSLDDPAAESRIAKLIMETPLDGTPQEEGRSGYSHCCEDREDGLQTGLYRYCIMRHNQKCDIVMDLAILLGKKSFAQKTLMCYKDSMHMYPVKTEYISTTYCKIWYDSSDKDAAQNKYDEAVENGVFQK